MLILLQRLTRKRSLTKHYGNHDCAMMAIKDFL